MTPEEEIIEKYLLNSHRCINPKCRSLDITGDSVEVDSGGASQDVSCNVCDSTWTDVYKLDYVENIEINGEYKNGKAMVARSKETS